MDATWSNFIRDLLQNRNFEMELQVNANGSINRVCITAATGEETTSNEMSSVTQMSMSQIGVTSETEIGVTSETEIDVVGVTTEEDVNSVVSDLMKEKEELLKKNRELEVENSVLHNRIANRYNAAPVDDKYTFHCPHKSCGWRSKSRFPQSLYRHKRVVHSKKGTIPS